MSILLLHHGWDVGPLQVPGSQFADIHLYTWVERGTMRVKCLAQGHNTVPRPGFEPGSLDPDSSALTIRPPRLHSSLWRDSYSHYASRWLSSLQSVPTGIIVKYTLVETSFSSLLTLGLFFHLSVQFCVLSEATLKITRTSFSKDLEVTPSELPREILTTTVCVQTLFIGFKIGFVFSKIFAELFLQIHTELIV